jgi:hypothetical protein
MVLLTAIHSSTIAGSASGLNLKKATWKTGMLEVVEKLGLFWKGDCSECSSG